MSRLIKVGDALSQLVNTIMGGHPNESISGRAYRENTKLEGIIDSIFFFQYRHCKTAYLNDVAYARLLILSDSKLDKH